VLIDETQKVIGYIYYSSVFSPTLHTTSVSYTFVFRTLALDYLVPTKEKGHEYSKIGG
jgi:hypothetical protein